MTLLLRSPHAYPERHLLYGGGGSGKTNCCLSIAAHIAEGHVHAIESDYTMAWRRALIEDFPEAEDKVTLYETDFDWEPWTETLAEVCAKADQDAGDWVMIDSVTPSWTIVQDWFQEQVFGSDIATKMRELKAQYTDDMKGYNAAVLDTMNWVLVKKEYQARVLRPLQRWRGNLVLTAEAKAVGKKPDDEERLLYGVMGLKPSGYTSLSHLAATNLLLSHPERDTWELTTIKDRNREEQDRLEVNDFALDYLMNVAGWERVRP